MTRAALWVVTVVVAVAAGVLSFDTLRVFGLAVGFPPHLAWLFPVAIEGGVAGATLAWRSGVAAVLGRRLTWGFLLLSVAGNATHHATAATGPWWWVAIVVAASAVPPVVFGTVVHLAVEVGGVADGDAQVRDVAAPATAPVAAVADPELPETPEAPEVPEVAEVPEMPEPVATPLHLVATPPATGGVVDVAADVELTPEKEAEAIQFVLTENAGRRRLMREMGLRESQARKVLAKVAAVVETGEVAR